MLLLAAGLFPALDGTSLRTDPSISGRKYHKSVYNAVFIHNKSLNVVSAAATIAFQLKHTRTIEYGKILVTLLYGKYYWRVYEVYNIYILQSFSNICTCRLWMPFHATIDSTMPHMLSQHQVHQELMNCYEVHFTASFIPWPHPKNRFFGWGLGTSLLYNGLALCSPCKM